MLYMVIVAYGNLYGIKICIWF